MSGESTSLIAEMAELTKLPHSQLAECLGEELQNAMKQVSTFHLHSHPQRLKPCGNNVRID